MKSVVGNKKAVKYLTDSLESGSFSHAYLFSGPLSVGKTKVALEVARKLLCNDGGDDDCTCHSCHSISSLTHPDLYYLSSAGAGIEEVREIVRQLSMKPYQSRYRVAVITHAENMTVPALNSFLKTLEEPSDNTVIILTTENKGILLDTIVSRTRQVSFGILPDRAVFEHLNQELGVKKEQAKDLTIVAAGRLGIAITLSEEESDVLGSIKASENFLRIYRSDSIAEKFSLAVKLVSSKDTVREQIPAITTTIRRLLLFAVTAGKKDDVNIMLSALDGLAKGEALLRRNISPKLVFESILLRSI
jgi:DNA polymerase III subunit delta'